MKVARKYGAKNVRLFGSFARGEQKTNSDVDLLVEMPRKSSLIDLAGMKMDLEKTLHRKVDVVTYGSIKKTLRRDILKSAKAL